MLFGLLAVVVMSIAVTTFFLVYDKADKKEESSKSDDTSLNNAEILNDKRENTRGVENISPVPTPQVVNYNNEHGLNNNRKKENNRVNVR